jgi:hypothetical protein
LWHLREAYVLFEAEGETASAREARSSVQQLTEAIPIAIGIDPYAALDSIGNSRLGSGSRVGRPLGLTLLTRSPYRDEDDPDLLQSLPNEVGPFFSDAVGTYALARATLTQINPASVAVPRWGTHTPQTMDHIHHAAIRQLWSVFEKVGWILNKYLDLGLRDNECSFARVFAKPHPHLARENPGLLALSGIAYAFRNGVYEPIKRLRHAIEHRSPAPSVSRDDAAFMLGIGRAAILHAIDVVLWEQFQKLDG